MENFKGKSLDGEWWATEQPNDHYKGILLLDEGYRGTLTLRGTEDQLASLPCDPVRRTFFGRLGKYPYEITLFNVGMKRGPSRTYPKDPDRETDAELYTNNILSGTHVESEEQTFLNRALIHLTGLEEWCDTTGFSGKLEQGVKEKLATETIIVSFQASTSPRYDLGDGRSLSFLSQYRGPSVFFQSKSVTLVERNTIELVFPQPISIRAVLAEITIWQNLITFGLRRSSYIDEVMLFTDSGYQSFTSMGLMVPGHKPEPFQGRRDPRQILFSRSKLGPNIASYLKAWRQKQDDIEIAVLLFTGEAYQEAVYIHTNLLTYLQALEILHRESFKRDRFLDPQTRKATIMALRAAVPTTLTETLQKEIREQLGYIGSLTLLDRLKHLFSLYPKSLTPLFRRGDEDMTLLKNTRNFLTHYGEQKSKEFLWSREIFVLKEKARLFLEICLLGTMGMSDDEIFELVTQFDPYQGWRMEVTMETANELLSGFESRSVST